MFAPARRTTAVFVATLALLAASSAAARADTTPSPATGLSATTTATSAVVSWKTAANAATYRVCLRETQTQSPCAVFTAPATATTWTFRNLEAGSGRYYFSVYSYNGTARSISAQATFDLKPAVPPAAPTGIIQTVGTSTLAVSWSPAAGATDYSVCLMTNAATETCAASSPRSSARNASFSGLSPTAGGDYFYRVYAYAGQASSSSAKHRVDLPVGPVTGFGVIKARTTSLQWSWSPVTNAETYRLQLSTSADMSAELRSYDISGAISELSVSGLTPGATYYARVHGKNGVVHGAYTAVLKKSLPTHSTPVTVITYNLCGQDHCRNDASSRARIEPWTDRKKIAGSIARSADADIIATQESHDQDTRFITELPGFSTGAYYSAKTIFYRTSRFTRVSSGVITLDRYRGRYAVWNVLQDKETLTPFFVTDAHLEPYKGRSKDDLRYAQTRVLVAAIAKANTRKYPVIYAGDYNSNKSNADQDRYPGGYDAPLKVFTGNGISDGIAVARDLLHMVFNSANQALNPPLKHTDHVDHIFVTPDVRVDKWEVVIRTKDGLYVTPFATDHNPVKAQLLVHGRPGSVG